MAVQFPRFQTGRSRFQNGRSRWLPTVAAVLLAAAGAFQAGCGGPAQVEGKTKEEPKPGEAGFFTVPPDQLAHLAIAPARTVTWSTAVHTTGTVDWDADHTTQAITQVNGPIARIMVDLGSRVSAGQPLLYVSSPDVAGAISAYRKARNREDLTKRVMLRQKELLDRGAVAVKDYESSQADYNDAQTDVENSLQALRIFGIGSSDIERAETQGVPISPELPVRAPISGVIVQKLVLPGQLIQAGTTVCFMLSDVSRVWVQGHIFDRDLDSVHVGDPVEETNPGLDRAFHGTVSYVGAMVDPATRTTPVRIVTSNPAGLLKKDMFVDAVIHTASRRNIIAVPVSAVLRNSENMPMVYVEVAPGQFARRQISIGAQQDGLIEVPSGLAEGEKVVSEGSVFLQFANSYQ
jgi:cobalt-zinc-cadmium efflux system membrane fusion protein